MPMRTTEVPWFPWFLLVPRNSVCGWFPGSYPLQGTGTRNRLFGPSPDEVSRNQNTHHTPHVGGMSRHLKSPSPVGSPEPTHNPRGRLLMTDTAGVDLISALTVVANAHRSPDCDSDVEWSAPAVPST